MILINNSAYDVPGILTLPEKAKTAKADLPALIMLHGTGSQKDEAGDLYKKLADKLAAQGIASLRIDFAGNGDSKAPSQTYTLKSAVADGQAALKYLKKHSAIDGQRIGVLGFSQGALISQLLVLAEPEIKTMVVWSPVVGDGTKPMQKTFDTYYEEAKKNGHAVQNFTWRPSLKLSLDWFEELLAQRSLTEIKRYCGKLLAVSGTADPVTPWQNSVTLVEAAGSHNAAVVLLKGADHIFNVSDNKAPQAHELLWVTTDWLTGNL